MSKWTDSLFRVFGSSAVVPISSCVHYCGFRYGRGEFNPYENYIILRAKRGSREAAAEKFVEFLLHYRPRHFGDALGVELSRAYPLWFYPWVRGTPPTQGRLPVGWVEHPDESPDILTHFSDAGISRAILCREYEWLENSFQSIRANGYRPDKFGGTIRVRRLQGLDGREANLVLDGNHRIASLAALGYRSVQVHRLATSSVHEAKLEDWAQVKNGVYLPDDARRIFRTYFDGNPRQRTTHIPSRIVG